MELIKKVKPIKVHHHSARRGGCIHPKNPKNKSKKNPFPEPQNFNYSIYNPFNSKPQLLNFNVVSIIIVHLNALIKVKSSEVIFSPRVLLHKSTLCCAQSLLLRNSLCIYSLLFGSASSSSINSHSRVRRRW